LNALSTLREAFPGLKTSEPLARHSSFAIGGPADFYADVETLTDLTALRRATADGSIPVFFVGSGSNLLISDKGVRGLVIHLQGEFRSIVFEESRVTVGAAAFMPVLSKQAADRGLSGVEALIGVPGTVGGGLVMNAGTRDGWIGDVTESVDVLAQDGRVNTILKAECGFVYRHSRFGADWVIGAALRLKKSDAATVKAKIDAIVQYRSRTQPLATNNCGSVFKNPEQGPAAGFIEKAGLKGHGIGGARISERHANFIVNENRASANDVRALIDLMQKTVREKFGVALEPEVRLVGEW
jgi:UDP-N-acetylmuramate dehydrogenase